MDGVSVSDEDRTIIFGPQDGDRLSAEELRQLLELPPGDDIRDYRELKAIGMGGLGAVFSAQEPGLNREVALKVLRPEFRNQPRHIESFIREARATAQIDHPNIVPVHRMGIFKDVGVYFTMKRIEGETLRAVIRKLADGDADYQRRYSLSRRLEIFIAICQGVAFAHSRGILHRDLKPGNIMLGDYGEVLIMDWGLASYRREKDQSASGRKLELNAGVDPGIADRAKTISGTPAYMAPEQAAGRNELIDEKSDIYCLGAILYSLLTLAPAPYDAEQPTDRLLAEVIRGRLVRPRRRAPLQSISRELEAIVLKAMARRREDRYASVRALMRDVRNYLDKYPVEAYSAPPFYRLAKLCMRRPLVPVTLLAALLAWGTVALVQGAGNHIQTMSLVRMAEYSLAQSEAYGNLALRTARLLKYDSGINTPEENRRKQELARELSTQTQEFYIACNAALESLAAIRRGGVRREWMLQTLGTIIRQQLNFCLATGNDELLRRQIRQFRSRWKEEMPDLLARDRRLARLLSRVDLDDCSLTVELPPQTTARLRRTDGVEPVAEWIDVPGGKPLRELKSGGYLLEVKAAGRKPVSYPLELGAATDRRMTVAAIPVIPRGMALVPGGEFHAGTTPTARNGRLVSLGSFLIGRREVTVGEYLDFWRRLTDPRLRERYRARYTDADGRSRGMWDDGGQLLPPFRAELPITGITGEAAEAYCRALSARHGGVYRLPTHLEWEKAGRGVDGRTYVWGDDYRPGAALLNDHPRRAEYPHGAPPGSFPLDRSGYEVDDLAGNVREFVRNTGDDNSIYTVMGGSFLTGSDNARCWATGSCGGRENDIGFRVVREVPPDRENDFVLETESDGDD